MSARPISLKLIDDPERSNYLKEPTFFRAAED